VRGVANMRDCRITGNGQGGICAWKKDGSEGIAVVESNVICSGNNTRCDAAPVAAPARASGVAAAPAPASSTRR